MRQVPDWGAVVIVKLIKKKRDIVAKMGNMANELLLSLSNNERPSETEWIKFQTAFCWNNWFGGQRRLQDGRRVAWVYS
ncbi:hypothetical protein HMPREF2608_02915 [Neisseria sp. HMSC064D07]|nr:hypothetical protein HMPREF2608_02915 [Neisseria sp. HMSC064D07]